MEASLFGNTDQKATSTALPGLRPLFTYGSLMHPPITLRVLKTSALPPSRSGVLSGYRRLKVPGAPYPGIVASSDECVTGTLLYLSDESYYTLLDVYEGEWSCVLNEKGDGYERRTVSVKLMGDEAHPEGVECDVYVYLKESGGDEWDFDSFVREYKAIM
jgi:gamma-glutamylcyclotransferase (GGCT)/AIG2-like uncharacterized protein YtfP